jgi:hypothetical protein
VLLLLITFLPDRLLQVQMDLEAEAVEAEAVVTLEHVARVHVAVAEPQMEAPVAKVEAEVFQVQEVMAVEALSRFTLQVQVLMEL